MGGGEMDDGFSRSVSQMILVTWFYENLQTASSNVILFSYSGVDK